MLSAIEISVVVCTFNRADLLRVCLETLVTQDFSPSAYEIIVVDNNSRDATAAVASEFAARYSHVRSVFEPTQGLSNARNRGWREARGAYVAYVDDECKVPPTWLSNACTVIAAHAPDMLGGPYGAWYAMPKPPWFKDAYGSTYFKGAVARPLPEGEYLSGGNMLLRRDLLIAGGFDPHLGMNGENLSYGEETVFQIQLRERKPACLIYYDPALLLYHMVRPEKMQLRHVLRGCIARGRSSAQVFPVVPSNHRQRLIAIIRSIRDLARHLALTIWHASLGLLLRDRTTAPYPQNHIYEKVFHHIQSASHMSSRIWRLIQPKAHN